MLVLNVEDEPTSQNYIAQILSHQNYDVISFSNALEALDYIRVNEIDLAIIDFKLGVPNGIALAQQVRWLHPACVIMMISQYAGRDDVIESMHVGADDFLVKPVTADQLLHRTSEAILRRSYWFPRQKTLNRAEGELELDLAHHTAKWHGRPLSLTPAEYALLAQLTSMPGRVFNYAELYAVSKGEHLNRTKARTKIKAHIANLRRKLSLEGYAQPIANVPGIGFKWVTS